MNSAEQGLLESPNYPSLSMVSKNCTYTISVPLGHIVRLTIEEMDIEFDHRCIFDYLAVKGQRYCGKTPPPPIYSFNNELRIQYVNDESKPSRGFRGKYEAIEIGCGGVLKQGDPMVAISVDRLSDRLPVHQCFWEIQANQSFVAMIKFYPSETRSSMIHDRNTLSVDSCSDHYVMINDTDGSLIKRFCIGNLPPPITSSGNILFMTYVFDKTNESNYEYSDQRINTTDQSRENKNSNASRINNLVSSFNQIFYATYHFMPSHSYCDRNHFKNVGKIRSPRYPHRYPPNRNCTWIIHVDNGMQIKLNFTLFRLEPPSEINSHCYDYLEIRNGRNSNSPLIGKFCGSNLPRLITSHGNYIFLRFISDASMQNRGFELNYEAMSSGCGGLMTAESGSIESPETYGSNLNCEWKIRISEGSTIVAYIVNLDFGPKPDNNLHCESNYIEFFEKDNNGRSLGRFCSLESRNPVVKTQSNQLFLKFTIDASLRRGGFKLNYHTDCNRTISGRYGVIESPNYPDSHPHNLNCRWHILGPLGNNITVIFTEITLENSIACKYDHINISEVIRSTPYDLSMVNHLNLNEPFDSFIKSTLCGNYTAMLPLPIRTKSNEIIITFVSDETRSMDSGFRLEWAAEGCGDNFRNLPYGVISSPNYPHPYSTSIECLWHIRAEPGHKIDLYIEEFDLDLSYECSYSYLKIFSGPDENSPLLSNLCDRGSNIHLSSFGDTMTVKFFSHQTIRKGFNATFRTTDEGCGGILSVRKGFLSLPDASQKDCSFLLMAEENYDIEITVLSYRNPGRSDCIQNHLRIFDGDSDQSPLLAELCQQTTESFTLRSNDSSIYIHFKSNTIGSNFNITYEKVCGKTIIIDNQMEFKEITSINYPHHYKEFDKCRFLFRASNPNDRLTFRYSHLDLINEIKFDDGSNETCEAASAIIYDSDQESFDKRLQTICVTFQTIKIPAPVVTSGDTLLLVTYNAIFRALISSIKSYCGGDFDSIEGFISSPGYPNSYPLNIECIWKLNAAPSNIFELEFRDFDLESSEYCNNDYLEIRLDNSSGLIIGDRRLCGKLGDQTLAIPKLLVEKPGSLWLKFRTDEIGVAKGFLLFFRLSHSVQLSMPNGVIGSPGNYN